MRAGAGPLRAPRELEGKGGVGCGRGGGIRNAPGHLEDADSLDEQGQHRVLVRAVAEGGREGDGRTGERKSVSGKEGGEGRRGGRDGGWEGEGGKEGGSRREGRRVGEGTEKEKVGGREGVGPRRRDGATVTRVLF